MSNDNLQKAYEEFWEDILLDALTAGELQATAFFECIRRRCGGKRGLWRPGMQPRSKGGIPTDIRLMDTPLTWSDESLYLRCRTFAAATSYRH